MTIYTTFTGPFDLPAAVAALEVRDLARVIGRHPGRDEYPDMGTRELAREVIREAAARLTCQKQRDMV